MGIVLNAQSCENHTLQSNTHTKKNSLSIAKKKKRNVNPFISQKHLNDMRRSRVFWFFREWICHLFDFILFFFSSMDIYQI